MARQTMCLTEENPREDTGNSTGGNEQSNFKNGQKSWTDM